MPKAEDEGRALAARVERDAPPHADDLESLASALPDGIEVRESPTRQGFCLHHRGGGATIYVNRRRPESGPHEACEALFWTGLGRALKAAGSPTAKTQILREESCSNRFTEAYLAYLRRQAED